MDAILAARAAAEAATNEVVRRHRTAEILTWALLHQMESEVLAEVAATGRHSMQVLAMLRAPAAMNYLRDNRSISFAGHELMPIAFDDIEAAWRCLH